MGKLISMAAVTASILLVSAVIYKRLAKEYAEKDEYDEDFECEDHCSDCGSCEAPEEDAPKEESEVVTDETDVTTEEEEAEDDGDTEDDRGDN